MLFRAYNFRLQDRDLFNIDPLHYQVTLKNRILVVDILLISKIKKEEIRRIRKEYKKKEF